MQTLFFALILVASVVLITAIAVFPLLIMGGGLLLLGFMALCYALSGMWGLAGLLRDDWNEKRARRQPIPEE